MRQYTLDLLKRLESAVPPPANCHHALNYAQYGSYATRWQEKLALQVNIDGTLHCFLIGPEDDGKSPEELAAEIVAQLANCNAEPEPAEQVPPPVDRSARVLTNGAPVTEDHRDIDPSTGQQKGYVVLTAEERVKGFVRQVRDTY